MTSPQIPEGVSMATLYDELQRLIPRIDALTSRVSKIESKESSEDSKPRTHKEDNDQ